MIHASENDTGKKSNGIPRLLHKTEINEYLITSVIT